MESLVTYSVKKHVCCSSQTFADRRLRYFEIWHNDGVDAALKFALEDRAEKARTATRDAMLGTQALAAAAATSAAGSGCPADGSVAAAIGIAAASAALKTPCMREPRGSNTEDDMLEEQFEKWYA
jgi:hypothetical protein